MTGQLRLAVLAATVALCAAAVVGVSAAVSGPALTARETERALAVDGRGRPASYACDRLWLDYWDYRCRWEEPAVGWIVVTVRVGAHGIVERSVE